MRYKNMSKSFLWTNTNFIVEGQDVWLVPSFYNCLCKYNLKLKYMEKVKEIPQMSTAIQPFYNMVSIQDDIIMIPAREDKIVIYNRKKDFFYTKKLKNCISGSEKFQAYAVWGDWIYMFPIYYPYIVKFNIKTYAIEYITDDTITELVAINKPLFMLQNAQVKNTVYLTIYNSNKIYRFDMDLDQGECIEVGDKKREYVSVFTLDKWNLALLEKKGDIVILNSKKDGLSVMESYPNYDDTIMNCFIKVENSLYIFPKSVKGEIKKFDIDLCSMEKAEFSDLLCKKDYELEWWEYNAFSYPVYSGSNIYVMSIQEECLYEIILKKSELKSYVLSVDKWEDALLSDLFKLFARSVRLFYEGKYEYLNIDTMIKYIKNYQDNVEIESQNVGCSIYKDMKLNQVIDCS